MIVFEFFFSAAAGIIMGAAIIIVPCMFIYHKFISSRNGRRRQ